MSYCKEEGKDKIIFVTKEDQDEPVQTKDVKDLETEDDHEEGEGLILENGDINWNCPCLGGMASGPCGMEFRDAFSCFHYSEADPKGSDCIDNFRTMQECMVNYPELYPVGEDKEKAMLEETEGVSKDEVQEEVHHISESLEITQEKESSSGIEKGDEEESTVVSSEAKATEIGSAASSSETDNDTVAKESTASDIQEECKS